MILTIKEKEQLVIKLANEGKSTKNIAQIAHVSLGDIGKIIRKFTGICELPKQITITNVEGLSDV